MGILDEAIREHLELKRAHGADDSELKQLEDQAFGQAERPGAEAPGAAAEAAEAESDAVAEAPTEFMSQPEPPAPRREPAAGMTDIQEAPGTAEEPEVEEVPAEERPAAEAPPAAEGRPAAEGQPAAEASPATEQQPAAEEPSAAEHEAVTAPVEHTTEERHAIADQPTQMFDVEEEFAATDAPAPPDEDLVAEEMTEPRLRPAEPLTPAPEPAAEDDEEDDFFDEQRLSDELDQALEAPLERESEPETELEPAPRADQQETPSAEKADGDEDVLEETPEFLEQSPEDDELWFEQKPPKDFDFDD